MINDVDDTLSIILSFLSPQCSEVCRRWSRINDKQTFAALGMPLCSMCRERPWRDRLIRGVVYYSNMFPMHFGCFNATIASGSSSSFFPHHRWLSDVSMSSSSSSSFFLRQMQMSVRDYICLDSLVIIAKAMSVCEWLCRLRLAMSSVSGVLALENHHHHENHENHSK